MSKTPRAKDPRVYLAQILERVCRIEQYTTSGREAFLGSSLLQDAVIRNLEVIGEAAKRVSDEYRAAHPELAWRGMAALRDVLIHNYEGVDPHQVWLVVERELPPLKSALAGFLPSLQQMEKELADEADNQTAQ